MAAEAAPVSRVVQFGNPADPTYDERRQMHMGKPLFAIGLAVPAFGMLAYSALASAGLAWALSPNPADATAHVIIALLISLAAGFLPLAAGVFWKIEQKKPKYERDYSLARKTMLYIFLPLWLLSIASAIGHIDFVWQSVGTEKPSPTISPRRLEAAKDEVSRFRTQPHSIRTSPYSYARASGDEIFANTKNCMHPVLYDERVRCEDLIQQAGVSASMLGDIISGSGAWPSKSEILRRYAPEWLVPWLHIGSTVYFHLISAIVAPFLLVIAFAVIDFFMMPPDRPSYASPLGTPVDVKKVDSFKEWWRDCVTIDQNIKGVNFKDIFQNYEDWSWANTGSPQYGKTEFANKLKSHVASDTQGVVKRHSGGTVYDGMRIG